MRGALAIAILAALLAAPLASARAITIHAGSSGSRMSFTPAIVTVDEGERVDLTVVNDDPSTPHDWAALEYGGRDVEVYVRGGESRSVSFTANEVGEFRIVCQVVGHKQQGMEGTLIVKSKLFVPLPGGLALVALALAAGSLFVARRAGMGGRER